MKKISEITMIASCIVLSLASFVSTATASSVMEGVWDNYILGTNGTWQLSYHVENQMLSATMDFDGDFLGNGGDPAPITLAGPINSDGISTFNVFDHTTFGDVVATIDQAGHVTANATNLPDPDIRSVSLTGDFMPNSFEFLYDVEFESGLVTHGTQLINLSPTITHTFTVIPIPSAIWLLIPGLSVCFSISRRSKSSGLA